jgi:hypothetical protein
VKAALLRQPNGRSRDCSKGRQAVQDEGTGDHATGQRRQLGDNDSGTGSVSTGLAKLFRLLRNARGAGVPHALGPLATASGAVATVENSPSSPSSVAGPRGPTAAGHSHGWQRAWPVVPRAGQGPLSRTLQCALRLARPSAFDRRRVAQPTRTAVYGPVRTVVWQGSAGNRRPYADVCWACATAWRCKSSGQPDGGEGLAMMQGRPPRGGV